MVLPTPLDASTNGTWGQTLNDHINSLDARLGKVDLDLVAGATKPYYIAHRGGSLRHPEETMLGLEAAQRDGFWLEVDCSPAGDGEIICIHDATVDRTMTGATGDPGTMTTEQFRQLSVKPAIPGGRRDVGLIWEDVLNRFGGRAVLIPEMKGTWTLAQRNAFYQEIIDRNLTKSVVIQSFTYSYCLEAVAKGIRALALGTAQTASQMAADKIWGVGCATSTAKTYTDAAKAAGIKVMPYTVSTLSVRDTWLVTNAVDGIFSDDPWWCSRRWPAKTDSTEIVSDNFGDKVPWPGMRGNPKLTDTTVGDAARSPRGDFVGAASIGVNPTAGVGGAANTYGIPMTFVSPRGPNVLVRTDAFYHRFATSQNQWCGIYFGTMDPEVGYNDNNTSETGCNGAHFIYRRSGELAIYRIVSATTAFRLAQNLNGPVIPAGVEAGVTLILEVNSTNVVGRVIVGATTYTVTFADTAQRPTNAYAQLNTNGQFGEFSNFSIRSI